MVNTGEMHAETRRTVQVHLPPPGAGFNQSIDTLQCRCADPRLYTAVFDLGAQREKPFVHWALDYVQVVYTTFGAQRLYGPQHLALQYIPIHQQPRPLSKIKGIHCQAGFSRPLSAQSQIQRWRFQTRPSQARICQLQLPTFVWEPSACDIRAYRLRPAQT